MVNTLTIDKTGALHQRIDGLGRHQYFISNEVLTFVDIDAMKIAGWVVTDYRNDDCTVIVDMMHVDLDDTPAVEAATAALVWGMPQTV